MTVQRSGYVAIIGRPNVGKSTLLNCLIGKKISITAPKAQTTRWQVLGIKTQDDAQIIYVDTPGIHHAEKRAMNRYLNRIAEAVIPDTDLVVVVVEANRWNTEDDLVLSACQKTDHPVILAINKVDLIDDKKDLLPLIEKLKEKYPFAHLVPIAAINSENTKTLETEIAKLLPDGPALFPEDQLTDKSELFQIAEIIREKLILFTEEELPYTTAVEIEHTKQEEKHLEINAVIWVERSGQKGIVIGKNGAKLKKIGTAARKEIEKLIGQKVFLRLWVKIKENWTDDDRALRQFGYE